MNVDMLSGSRPVEPTDVVHSNGRLLFPALCMPDRRHKQIGAPTDGVNARFSHLPVAQALDGRVVGPDLPPQSRVEVGPRPGCPLRSLHCVSGLAGHQVIERESRRGW